MLIFGFVCSILIGISLGLIGSGGSILMMPVLVYLFLVNPVTATTYSLFIVGFTAGIGSINYFRKGLVNLYIALIFGTPSVLSVFFTRAFLLPSIPSVVFTLGNYAVSKATFLMLIFAVLMIFAALSMLISGFKQKSEELNQRHLNYPLIIFLGALEGSVTGLVGVGGGFLIIPILVLLTKLPIKSAVGTSLIIIASKSVIGFSVKGNSDSVDWYLIAQIIIFTLIGLFIGIYLSKKTDALKLKPLFAWFLLILGLYIIIKETFIK